MAIGVFRTLREFRMCAFFRERKWTHSPLYTNNDAKPPKELSILRTKRKLRQQGVRRRDRDLCGDCLKRRSGSRLRDGERGNRKSGRAAARPKHLSKLNKKRRGCLDSPLALRAYIAAAEALAHTLLVPLRSFNFSSFTTLSEEPDSAFGVYKPHGLFSNVKFDEFFFLKSSASL
eukprot:3899905-Pleurochrysis_carterae.AAC.2